MRPQNAALVVIWVCLIFVRVRVVREEHRERGVCSRTPFSLVGARPRGRTRTGVGVSCSPAVSDGTCEATCACRVMRGRHSSANSEVVSCTGGARFGLDRPGRPAADTPRPLSYQDLPALLDAQSLYCLRMCMWEPSDVAPAIDTADVDGERRTRVGRHRHWLREAATCPGVIL